MQRGRGHDGFQHGALFFASLVFCLFRIATPSRRDPALLKLLFLRHASILGAIGFVHAGEDAANHAADSEGKGAFLQEQGEAR